MAAKKEGKKAQQGAQKWPQKCPKRLKMKEKEGSPLKEKLVAK